MVLAGYVQRTLDSTFLLQDLVCEADVEWGRVFGERPYFDQIVWACLTGICYLPSTVVPVGLDSRGLPIGVAVAGPYLEDRTSLAVVRALLDVLPSPRPPDVPAS